MRFLLLAAIMFLSVCVQAKGLSAESQKVKFAYEAVVRDGSLPDNQLFYITSFPDTKDGFIRVFGPNSYDQLFAYYPEYMAAFRKYGNMYPKHALPRAMAISKGLVWSGGAIGELHSILLDMANDNTALFVDELKKLKTKKERNAVINFVSDTVTPEPFPAYQALLAKLDETGNTTLAQQLRAAFAEQQKSHKEGYGK